MEASDESATELDVLLIEDNPGDARLIEELLKDVTRRWTARDDESVPESFRLRHATRLSAGLETFEEAAADIVLLDLGLPDSEGLDTLAQVLDVVDRAPVLVLTGLPETELGIEAVRRGAQDYLVKDDLGTDSFAHAVQYALERKKTEQELQRRTDELAILNQLMRHDIKNDISLVIGRGHELSEYVDPRGEDLLAEIITAANHVLQLTRTIGDTVEAITSQQELEREPVDLRRILETEVQNAQRLYGDAAVTLEEPFPSVQVLANELLSAVFGNLVSNALLYAGESPTVEVGVECEDDVVRVSVADNGPGIPDARKDEIFGQGVSGYESQGIGIGLYLVDQLVDRYEGTVWVEDNEPSGAVFYVELERADGERLSGA